MPEVLPQLLLHLDGAFGERCAATRVHLQQDRRAEVAHDRVHLRVQRHPVEEEHVQGEVGVRAPLCDHLGVRGADGRGRGDPGRLRVLQERRPGLAVEPVRAVHEVRPAHGGGVACQRQFGRGRHVGDPAAPVLEGGLVLGALFQFLHCGDVVAEGDLRGLAQVLAVDGLRPLAEYRRRAPRVADQRLVRDVQTDAPLAEDGGADVEQGPFGRVEDLVAHLVVDGGQLLVARLGLEPGHVVGADLVTRHLGQHPLGAVAVHHRSEHVVAFDQLVELVGQKAEVGAFEVDLGEEVGRDVAELEGVRAAHHVGLLEVGEREGFEPRGRVGHDPRRLVRHGFEARLRARSGVLHGVGAGRLAERVEDQLGQAVDVAALDEGDQR